MVVQHVDAGVEQHVHVLPALAALRAGHVGVREFVDQADLRLAPQDGLRIHLLERGAAILDRAPRHHFQAFGLGDGVLAAVRLEVADDHVDALARAAPAPRRACARSCRRRPRSRDRFSACRALRSSRSECGKIRRSMSSGLDQRRAVLRPGPASGCAALWPTKIWVMRCSRAKSRSVAGESPPSRQCTSAPISRASARCASSAAWSSALKPGLLHIDRQQLAVEAVAHCAGRSPACARRCCAA